MLLDEVKPAIGRVKTTATRCRCGRRSCGSRRERYSCLRKEGVQVLVLELGDQAKATEEGEIVPVL